MMTSLATALWLPLSFFWGLHFGRYAVLPAIMSRKPPWLIGACFVTFLLSVQVLRATTIAMAETLS